ncbi:MAG: alanine racemase [Gemmatimonadetes bacterium]|nr:alanine racemase [Gemmatimonadota bacterium]
MPSIADHLPRAWAEVDLAAVVSNARTVSRIAGARLLPMVKANAYGLGAVPVARALEAVEPWGYGVATPEEGAELRRAGIARPIVVFSPLGPATVEPCLRADLRPVIGDLEGLAAWQAAGRHPFHVEVDTGMARAGFRWDEAPAWRSAVAAAGAACEGIFTHFHSADEAPASMVRQWERFRDVLALLPDRPALVHAANSAAALRGPDYAADLVRPGIFLYGGAAAGHEPATAVRLEARVVALRTVAAGDSVSYGASWVAPAATRIATLGVGYADGLHRSLGGCGVVELGGRRVRVVGRVTMDFTMVAVEGPAALGDVATVFGGLVSVDEQAALAGTIAYELLTALGPRIPRRYEGAA